MSGVRPKWGVKENALLKQDLARVGQLSLLKLCMEVFFDDVVPNVAEWVTRTGYTYVSFHAKLDALLMALRRKR